MIIELQLYHVFSFLPPSEVLLLLLLLANCFVHLVDWHLNRNTHDIFVPVFLYSLLCLLIGSLSPNRGRALLSLPAPSLCLIMGISLSLSLAHWMAILHSTPIIIHCHLTNFDLSERASGAIEANCHSLTISAPLDWLIGKCIGNLSTRSLLAHIFDLRGFYTGICCLLKKKLLDCLTVWVCGVCHCHEP